MIQAAGVERERAGYGTHPRGEFRGYCLTGPAPPAPSAKAVPYALVHNKSFHPPSCSALHPEHRKGSGEEDGATLLHMKHRINRIAQDVNKVKDDEVLPEVKEHLTLPLKTSLKMPSKVKNLHK